MKRAISIFVIVIISCLFICACMPMTYYEYTDKNIYINRLYFSQEYFGENSILVENASKFIDRFLIPYEDIDFEYEDINCFVFDGTGSITRPGISLSVDFHIGENYDEVEEIFLQRFEFYEEEKYNLSVNEYECFVVKDSKITKYIEYFGLICFNEENKTIRQFYYYDHDFDMDDKSLVDYFEESIKKCSNCPW